LYLGCCGSKARDEPVFVRPRSAYLRIRRPHDAVPTGLRRDSPTQTLAALVALQDVANGNLGVTFVGANVVPGPGPDGYRCVTIRRQLGTERVTIRYRTDGTASRPAVFANVCRDVDHLARVQVEVDAHLPRRIVERLN